MPDFLAGGLGQFFVVLLVLATVSLLAWALINTFSKPPSELSAVLSGYGMGGEGEMEHEESIDDRLAGRLVKTELVRRVVDSASQLEVGKTVVGWLERRLDQANVPLRAPEALFAYAVGAALASLLTVFLVSPLLALVVAVLLTLLPLLVLNFLAKRRRSKFTSQLPDALQLLSGTLRAGFSLVQGIETLAAEVGDPMGHELHRVLAEARLGRPMEDALADMAERLESPDFEWTVMAIAIQREVGGNLAELLDTVAETMVARSRLRGEVKALTAEGRISAIVIGFMPVALGAFMYIVNPEYSASFLHDPIGQKMLVGSGLLAAFGFWWMKKTIEIDV
jgi:tight adherence protein B